MYLRNINHTRIYRSNPENLVLETKHHLLLRFLYAGAIALLIGSQPVQASEESIDPSTQAARTIITNIVQDVIQDNANEAIDAIGDRLEDHNFSPDTVEKIKEGVDTIADGVKTIAENPEVQKAVLETAQVVSTSCWQWLFGPRK